LKSIILGKTYTKIMKCDFFYYIEIKYFLQKNIFYKLDKKKCESPY